MSGQAEHDERETFAGGIPPEVAPVRAGEELDWRRLAAYLAEPSTSRASSA